MKKLLLVLAILVIGSFAKAAADQNPSLEDQLKSLDLPANQAPASVSKEKLYIIQERYLPLTWKSEVSVGGAMNFSGSAFLNTTQAEIGYRLHLSDHWSIGGMRSFVSNSFNAGADKLKNENGIIPDVIYAKDHTEAFLSYNVFYGKFRLSQEQVFYFDQYVSAGADFVNLVSGGTTGGMADVGFAFWLGKWGSIRIGAKDYIYQEPRVSGKVVTSNIHGHIDIGYLF